MAAEEDDPRGWIKVTSKSKARYRTKHKKCINQSSPSKQPSIKEQKLSDQSVVIGKKNLASQRLKRLQETLRNEVADSENSELVCTKKEGITASTKDVNHLNGTSTNVETKANTAQEVETLKSDKTREQSPRIEHRLSDHSIVIGRKNLASQRLKKLQDSLKEEAKNLENNDLISIKNSFKENILDSKKDEPSTLNSSFTSKIDTNVQLSKDDFYIIVDTNVLLKNLSFVKQIKGKLFKDIGRAFIYLPYIVICELDRLKAREGNVVGKSARTAISYIEECFNSKDEFIRGQNAMECVRRIIEIDSDDDKIINSALQLKINVGAKIILLSNDKNLRNKAFINGIGAYSSDVLKSADYNNSHSITFE